MRTAAPTGPGSADHGERGGHPLWLPRSLFAATLELPRRWVCVSCADVIPELRLPVDDAEILRDPGHPQDLQRLRGE